MTSFQPRYRTSLSLLFTARSADRLSILLSMKSFVINQFVSSRDYKAPWASFSVVVHRFSVSESLAEMNLTDWRSSIGIDVDIVVI